MYSSAAGVLAGMSGGNSSCRRNLIDQCRMHQFVPASRSDAVTVKERSYHSPRLISPHLISTDLVSAYLSAL